MKHEHDGQFNTLGFLFYDLIHILVAVVVLILLFASDAKEATQNLSAEASFVSAFVSEVSEIILGLLLICFVDFIIKNVDIKIERILYTFAFLIASLALLLPALPKIRELIDFVSGTDGNVVSFVLSLLGMIVPLLALAFFALSLFKVRANLKLWATFLVVGMSLMILTSVIELISIINLLSSGEEFELVTVFEILALAAPVFPTIYGVIDLKKMGLIFSKKMLVS